MGMTKRLLEANDELNQIAMGVLCAADVVKECYRHSGTYVESGGSGDLEPAYRIAMARIRDEEISLPDGFRPRDLTDKIKQLGEMYWPDECPACAKDD